MNIDEELNKIFEDPLLDISEKEKSLFQIPEDMQQAQIKREKADYVANHRVCEEFEHFKPLFLKAHHEIKTGQRCLVKLSKTANIKPGSFFVISGQMVYLQSMEEKKLNKNNKRYDCRTRCIYENGTEADILLQTLRKGVMDNGYALTEPQGKIEETFMSNSEIQKEDKVTGYIYVLRSRSTLPEIQKVKNLYKIGFTINTVEERIAGAENDPTYLMAPVAIAATYKIVNLNSHVFETLIHQVLDNVQMEITITDKEGKVHHPKEWFVVPLEVVDTIITKILNGTITHYTYNAQMECLEKTIVKETSTFDTSKIKVLAMTVNKSCFDEIMEGKKNCISQKINQKNLKKYTFVAEDDRKRYLRRFDALRLKVSRNSSESALVKITNITTEKDIVKYQIGAVLEHIGQNL